MYTVGPVPVCTIIMYAILENVTCLFADFSLKHRGGNAVFSKKASGLSQKAGDN